MRRMRPWVHFTLVLLMLCAMGGVSIGRIAERTDSGAEQAPAGARTEASIPESWLEGVKADIRQSEYRFSLHEAGGWTAPNRAHDLRTHLTDSGVRITSRTKGSDADQGGWRLDLSTAAVGREGAVTKLEAVAPTGEAERGTFWRRDVTEWYVNDEKGLEQGFTVHSAPPRADDASAPLVLEMRLTTDLQAHLSEDAQTISFRGPGGSEYVRYHSLTVYDRERAPVTARLALSPGLLRILVDDQDAAYPLTIDPLFTTAQRTVEPNQKNSEFGFSVGSAGDVNGDLFPDVIVGAPRFDGGLTDEGRVFVYHGDASGMPAAESWFAESNVAGVQFGLSVGTAGDINGDGVSDVIVGSPLWTGSEVNEGRVFVWKGESINGLGVPGTPQNADWVSGPPACCNHQALFGWSVATAGDVNNDGLSDVIIGAPWKQWQYDFEGTAHIYLGVSGGTLQTTPAWTGQGGVLQISGMTPSYGNSVGTAGDVNGDGYSDFIVGAPGYDSGEQDEGRAYVYLGGTGANLGALFWQGESNVVNAFFGNAVGTAGDVNGDGRSDWIIGASGYSHPEVNEGAAFVWLGAAAPYGPGNPGNAHWVRELNLAGATLGYSVGYAGDVDGDGYGDVIVGAPKWKQGNTEYGAAWVHEGSATGLSATPVWMTQGNVANGRYGASVASIGDIDRDGYGDVIVGSPTWESASNQADEGRVWVYRGTAAGPATTTGWFSEGGNQAGSVFGASAVAGDINGDGYSDVIVGARYFDGGIPQEGRVFLFTGSAGGLVQSSWTADGERQAAHFGAAVASAGDVNGDGFSDIIIGAPDYWFAAPQQSTEGRAVVFLGSASGFAASPDWVIDGDQYGGRFGSSVASAGDVNGDGFRDVIVGAPTYSMGETAEGVVYVWHGSATGLGPNGAPASADWIAQGDIPGDLSFGNLGYSVASAGDVNRDGYSDILVGYVTYGPVWVWEGAIFVWLGSSSGLGAPGTLSNADWMARGNQVNAFLGTSLASGDFNNDGYSDIVVGNNHSNPTPNEGRVFVWYGGPDPTPLGPNGLPTNVDWAADGDDNNSGFGASVSSGDVNGDGISDVIVGAPNYAVAGDPSVVGRAFAWFGSTAGLPPNGNPTNAHWTAAAGLGGLGSSVAGGGDFDGDGFGDIVVAADRFDDGQSLDEGRVFAFYGNIGAVGASGKPRLLAQLRTTDNIPIAILGNSNVNNGFKVRLRANTPWGRGKVRLEWEVKPAGTLFNGTGLGTGAYVDTGAPGPDGSVVTFEQTIGGLAANAPYKWRARFYWKSPGSIVEQRSRWFTLPDNAAQERDLRTAP